MTANATEGRPGLVPAAIGVAGLAILVALLPVLGDPEVTLVEFVSAYVLILLPMGALLYGLLLLAADLQYRSSYSWEPSPGARQAPTSAAARRS